MVDAEAARAIRARAPRRSHGEWRPAAQRRDPVALLRSVDAARVPELVAIRYQRMLASPFAFYRGAAAVMAADLRDTPVTGLVTQICGDAHPANFGLFATPERRLVFSVNDFDETLPGPWEYDCKRLIAGLVVAALAAGMKEARAHRVAAAAAAEYRTRVAEYASMSILDVWYATVDVRECVRIMRRSISAAPERVVDRARRHHSLHAVGKLTEVVDGRNQFRHVPPLLCRLDDDGATYEGLRGVLSSYQASIREERHLLEDRFEVVDIARKVVGVGSVGTHCWVVLLEHRGATAEPLVLQLKEASASVLEEHLRPSEFANHGQRVVVGQRSMQAFPDIFLGWASAPNGRHYYVRQLEDMKGSFDIMELDAAGLEAYGRLCAWSLARAHARCGDAPAMAEFGLRYASQNETDYAALQQAAARAEIPLPT